MVPMTNRQVLLRRRPVGKPVAEDFEIVASPVPPVQDGEVLRRTIYLSLDPYMRGRMNEGPSYATPVALGQVMAGRTVSQVIESKNPQFRPGEYVATNDGWQQYGVSDGKDLQRLKS